MPVSDHSRELIQKYLDERASEAELAELEILLTTNQEVADAFAAATRLHASLRNHFQKQYKIDQIARLLDQSAASSTGAGLQPEAVPSESVGLPSTAAAKPPGSIFVPLRGSPHESRRARRLKPIPRILKASRRAKWVAAVVLLVAVGAATWFAADRGASDLPRVVAGRVVVAGRDVATIPAAALFDVMGSEQATIELPGGTRIELAAATQAKIRSEPQQTVVQLVTGGGQFHVPPDRARVRIETPLGTVTATGSQFSVNLMTASAVQFSVTEPIKLPHLTVVVASGAITIERGGLKTTLTAGDERVFL